MDETTSGTTEEQGNQAEVDPWIAAFAALGDKGAEGAEASAGGDGEPGGGDDAAAADGQVDSADAVEGQGNPNPDSTGGLGASADAAPGEDEGHTGSAFGEAADVTEDSIKEYEEKLTESIRQRAIDEVAAEFVKRGVRNTDGVLGATLDDQDICKRDEDGVPRFFNPETGREFTGDNPRRQAQEWVDDYNKELARVFNNACSEYQQHLASESEPQIAVMKFAPKYNKLDDIRRGMLDNIIQDYEVKDEEGKVVGYTCDLDKALAQVERQITMIQRYAKEHSGQQQQEKPQTPALDMKTSSGAVNGTAAGAPKSLAEAMEQLQDAQLSKLGSN